MRSAIFAGLFCLITSACSASGPIASGPPPTLGGRDPSPAATNPPVARSESSRPSPGIVLGDELCVPSSPRIPNAAGSIGTVVGTTSAGAQLFALMHPLIQAGSEVKIVVRMTGTGPVEMSARFADGTLLRPRLIEPHTLGSSFDAPGDEWGVFYTFPKAGCWQLHFSRTEVTGDIWFIAAPPL